MNTRSCLGAVSLVGLVTFLAGCPNPQTYGTPRTLDPGKWQIIAAVEGVGASVQVPTTNAQGQTTTQSDSVFLPNLPTVGARVGLADRVDLGFSLRNLYGPTLDVKINFLKTKHFDMAVAPMVNYFPVFAGTGSLNLFYFHVPLLLGINFSEMVSLVITPGFAYALAVGTGDLSSTNGASYYSSAPWARGGLGVNIRANRKISITPEFTIMHAFTDYAPTAYFFSIAGSFLNQPDYSEDWTGAKATED